jgi:hypothetical protein
MGKVKDSERKEMKIRVGKLSKGKGKAVPLQAWTGPEGS